VRIGNLGSDLGRSADIPWSHRLWALGIGICRFPPERHRDVKKAKLGAKRHVRLQEGRRNGDLCAKYRLSWKDNDTSDKKRVAHS